MGRALWAVCIAAALGCVHDDARREEAGAPPVTAGDEPVESYELAWSAAFDTQSALVVAGSTIFESGWHGIGQHAVGDGQEVLRFPGSDETFRACIGVGAVHDPVLVDLGSFVLGRDRRARLARFEAQRAEPLWISSACTRLYAATLVGDEVVALCGSGTVPPAPFPPGALVFLDAATGHERARVPLPSSSPFEEHAVIAAHGTIAARVGDRVVLADASPRVLAEVARPGSFGLAATERGFAIVENGAGVVELDAATGSELRRIALPVRGTPDPFTSLLGRLRVQEGTAYVEAGGEIRALSLADGGARWRAAGVGVVIDRDRAYACRGNRFVALDARSGATLYAYSTGTCEIVGVSGARVLVRYEALPARGADDTWAGVLAFERRAGPASPCERATVRGEVRVNGVIAPGLTVRAGNAWAAESSGVVHMWGGPMRPTGEPAAATATTDARGRYSLTVCERGHVPIAVDPEQARTFAGEEHADSFSSYVHLDGRGAYTLDFAVRAHEPEL